MAGDARIKELRYQVMLALYLPILLYSFSTFDLSEQSVAAEKVEPVLVGGQQTVVMGQKYNASAYLKAAQLAKGGQITLQTDDQKVTVQGNETINIPTAKLLSEGEEQKKVQYSVQMQYDQLQGQASQTLTGSFTVRRPELVATSVATTSLYRRTRNQIRIDVPGLENRPLQLEASSGAQVEGRQLTISPSSDNVTVRAYLPQAGDGERVLLGRKQFAVIDPPRPQIRVLNARGEQISNGESISRRRPGLQFKVEADAEFAKTYPQDANYRIRSARVSIRKGLQATQEIGTFDLGQNATLTRALIRGLREVGAQPKDRIIIQLQDVVRINHAGQAIPVDLNDSSLSYSFILA
ncbi:MAG: hypothetical protein ABEL97_01555 [Salinibacter sp.]